VYRISAHKDVYKEMLIWCFQQSVIEMKRVECGMKTGSTRPILCSGFRLFIFDGSSAACMTWLEALKVLCNISGCVSVLKKKKKKKKNQKGKIIKKKKKKREGGGEGEEERRMGEGGM